jgi:conjugative transfer signal peptidase TraF
MPEPRDLPLFRWAAELRRARRTRRRLRRRIAITAVGIVMLGVTITSPPAPRLVWNASASAPTGLYLVSPGTAVERGDMVVARTPVAVRNLAARRRYLPAHVPLVKRVVAVRSDIVCALGQGIFVDGHLVAERRNHDGQGRPMPWWYGCRTLANDELFLLMTESSDSFDGRYFGVTRTGGVIGKAALLWSR